MIRLNAIRCLKCHDYIESKHTHDFKWCACGAVAVDGGHEYLKRCYQRIASDDYEECSDYDK